MGCGSSTPATAESAEITEAKPSNANVASTADTKQEGGSTTVAKPQLQTDPSPANPSNPTTKSVDSTPDAKSAIPAAASGVAVAEPLVSKDDEGAAAKKKAEEEAVAAKKKADEEAAAAAAAAAKQKSEEEAAAKKKADEDAAAAKKKADEEAAAKKKSDEEAAAKQKADDEAKRKAEEALTAQRKAEDEKKLKEEADRKKKAEVLSASSAPATHVTGDLSKPVVSSEVAACDESLLYVLRLDLPVPAAELAVVHEMQKPGNVVRVKDPNGPGKLDERTAVLSWRWDIAKPATLEEAKSLPPSKKVIAAIERARELGHKWLWLDWATVPQYSTSLAEILNHVRASRFVYEQCSVILVDLVEVAPGIGLFLPTPDYISRLWTTAEMASMLANPNVNYGTFVQFRRWHWKNIAIASSASFSATMVRQNFVKEYKTFFEDYVNNGAIDSFHATQGSLHLLCYNIASTHLTEKYGPRLTSWLVTNSGKFHQPKPSPLTYEEEEKLIEEFGRDHDWDARKSPHCKGLFEAVNKSKRMPDSFDHGEHYKAFLLLATECMRYLLKKWQWNGAAYKSVLQRLGQEFPGATKLAANDPDNLQCFLESDVDKVREMIMAARGRIQFPVTIPGVEYIPVPIKQWLSVHHPLPRSLTVPKGGTVPQLGHVIRQGTMVAKPSLNDDTFPLRHIDVGLTWLTPGVDNTPAIRQSVSSDVYIPQTVLRFNAYYQDKASEQPLGDAMVNVESNAQWTVPITSKRRLGTDLQEGEFWLNLGLSYTMGNLQQKSIYLFRKVKGAVTTAQIADVIDAFDSWANTEFGKLLTDDDRATFLADADHKQEAVLESIVKKAGFAIGNRLVEDQVVEVDDRPDYPAEEMAKMADADKEKQVKIEKLLAMPQVKDWGLTPSTLSMMPLSSIEQLISSAEMMAAQAAEAAKVWGTQE